MQQFYILKPDAVRDFLADVRARGKKQFFILKPDAGCQGRGIRLLPVPGLSAKPPSSVRTVKRGPAQAKVNKHNDNFVANEGNKDSINAERGSIDERPQANGAWPRQGYIKDLWMIGSLLGLSIQEVIMKSIISVQPALKNNYRRNNGLMLLELRAYGIVDNELRPRSLTPDNDGFKCLWLRGYGIMLDNRTRNNGLIAAPPPERWLSCFSCWATIYVGQRRFGPCLLKVNHSGLSFKSSSPGSGHQVELVFDTYTVTGPAVLLPSATDDRGLPAARRCTGGGGPSAGGAAPNGGGTGGPSMGPDWKPKTVEEYEIWRAEVLRVREKYEAKHSGGYTRIYPSSNPLLQATYEELLKGANDIYSAAFSSRPKKAPVLPVVLGANDISSAAFGSRPKKAPVVPGVQNRDIKPGRAPVKGSQGSVAYAACLSSSSGHLSISRFHPAPIFPSDLFLPFFSKSSKVMEVEATAPTLEKHYKFLNSIFNG
eukprot:gene4791-34549_t